MISYFYILPYIPIKNITHEHSALIYFHSQTTDILTIMTHVENIFKIINMPVRNYVYWVDLQK